MPALAGADDDARTGRAPALGALLDLPVQGPSATPPAPRAPWVLALLALVALVLFAGFAALGVWQVERRAWKLDLIASVAQRLHAAPVAVPPAAQWDGFDAKQHLYLPVHLQGRWLPGKVALVQATTAFGAGYWLMMPLQQADGTQVLVNRGFVPQAERSRWLSAVDSSIPASAIDTAPDSLIAIDGLLRASEPGGGFLRHNDPAAQRWFSRDVQALAQALSLSHAAPFFVDAGLPDTSGRQEALADMQPATGPWPRGGLTVVHFVNNHLVYAITWFGLALMVVGAAGVVARYEWRLRKRNAAAIHAPPTF